MEIDITLLFISVGYILNFIGYIELMLEAHKDIVPAILIIILTGWIPYMLFLIYFITIIFSKLKLFGNREG